MKEEVKKSKLRIDIQNNRDRQDLFAEVCLMLKLSLTNEKKSLDVKSATPSYDALFKLLMKHDLDFSYDGETKKLTVICPNLNIKGAASIQAPEKINETVVDSVTTPASQEEANLDGFQTVPDSDYSIDEFEDDEEEEDLGFLDPLE